MKIRTGFVSNSSSTSFMIFGTIMSKDAVKDMNLWEMFKGTNIEWYQPPYDDFYFIGAGFESMGGDETRNQFQARVEAQLKAVLGDSIECSVISESWYDG